MWWELIIRFLIGGAVVSAFAVIGNLFSPKTFAGIFAAAPSVALATLVLTIAKHGPQYTAIEARSMIIAAAAFYLYSDVVSRVMMRRKFHALTITSFALPVWFIVAFGLWFILLR